MKTGNAYDFWLLPFASELDANHFLRALLGLAHELGVLRQIVCPSPASQVQTGQAALAVTINGGADAFGMDTFSSADVSMLVVDRGLAQCATGSATFVAVAEGSDQGTPIASAYAQLDIVGADISSFAEQHTSRSDANKAVDVAAVQFAAVGLVFEWTAGCGKDDVFTEAPTKLAADIGQLEGNLAEFSVTSSAFGENTFVSVMADAIAVQDALSSVVVSTTAAVDADVVYTSTTGTSRADTIAMKADLGVAYGYGGDDRITGGNGVDWIFGDHGNDTLSGGAGNDNLFGGAQADQASGGAGDDWLFGGNGSDTMTGDAGNDLLFGNDDADQISGAAGMDIINGGRGADKIDGGAGDDWLQLGAPRGDGNDKYTGGAGADHYLLQAKFDNDAISDFSIVEGDRLVLAYAEDDDPSIGMQRSGKDLVVNFNSDDHRDQLTLTNFFGFNLSLQGIKAGSLSATQIGTVLDLITASSQETQDLHLVQQTLTIGDMLSSIG